VAGLGALARTRLKTKARTPLGIFLCPLQHTWVYSRCLYAQAQHSVSMASPLPHGVLVLCGREAVAADTNGVAVASSLPGRQARHVIPVSGRLFMNIPKLRGIKILGSLCPRTPNPYPPNSLLQSPRRGSFSEDLPSNGECYRRRVDTSPMTAPLMSNASIAPCWA
jgi:hypothetical protein